MTIYKKDSPVLIEKGIQEIQDLLGRKLAWLDNIFGRVVKLNKDKGNKIVTYPAFYKGGAEYVELLPQLDLGNYCFFEVYNPQEVDNGLQDKVGLSFQGAIVFWYDQRTINPDPSHLWSEEIKQAVLEALRTPGSYKNVRVQMLRVIEEPELIFKGYGIKQIDTQFLMYPYFGLRIECSFKVLELC